MGALNNRLVNRQRALARALADATHLTGDAHTVSLIARETARITPAPEFSARERDLLPMLLKGLPNREIGRLLDIEVSAVKARLRTIFRKLGVSSRAQAVIALAASLPPRKEN
jgi:DNA-binding NarL/FixJ family response regulator